MHAETAGTAVVVEAVEIAADDVTIGQFVLRCELSQCLDNRFNFTP